MKKHFANSEKQDLMFKWSNDNGEKLAKEALNIWGKNEKPKEIVTPDSYNQYLNNIIYGISKQFNVYDKLGKYTNSLSEYELTDKDKVIFINTLILNAASIVTGNIFYTD
jgi:hypothetical protein